MDFEQLAFIEKWRRRASRGVVVALDATRGDVLLTLRVGDLGATLDLRGRDTTGAVRKQRVTIGDRLFAAFRYQAVDATPANGAPVARLVAKGAELEGTVTDVGELVAVDVAGVTVLLERDDATAAFAAGEAVRFRVADEGHAYVIPTR